MNQQNYIYTPFVEQEDVRKKNIGQVISRYAYHWPLFFICMLVCGLLAFTYVKQLNPVYHVRSKISIQDDKKQLGGDKEAALMQLSLTTGAKLIEGEAEVIKSRPLIRKVVNELQLWTKYVSRDGYADHDLYKSSPVKLVMLSKLGHLENETFEIAINDAKNYTLTNENGDEKKVAFGARNKNGFGEWMLVGNSNLKEYTGKKLKIHLTNPELVVTEYQTNIMITLNSKASMLELNLDDVNPERGTDVLDNLVANYKEFNVIDKNKETESTLKFIQERLASLSGELTSVEKDVEGYKSSVSLTDVSSKSQFFLDNVQSNDTRISEVDIQLHVIRGIEKYVQSGNESDSPPATLGISDPGMIGLVEQLSSLQLQRDKLLAITPSNNPIFVPLNKQIVSVRNAIKENIKGVKSSLLNTRNQLTSNNSRFESGIKSMPGQERQYISIKRQQAIKENLYVFLLQKKEEVSMSYASTLTDARTIEQAYFGKPESQRVVPLFLGALLGLLFPIGIITGRERIRNRVMTRKDIEAATNAPIIAELSQEKNSKPIVVLNRQAYALGEQLRGLRTDILQVGEPEVEKGKVIMFLSSVAGEGKSFVASNIATAMAAMGKKTVILELDLRKPAISKMFKLDPQHIGLSNLLNNECEKEDVLQPSGVHPNLSFMGSGPVPYNPSELIQSNRMKELLDELKDEYDAIVLDSTPLHLVSDAMILAPMTDVCMYMVRHNYTPKSELKFIDDIYRRQKFPNMNLVFNGVQMDSRYGYSIDYGYYADKPNTGIFHSLFGDFSKRF